MILYFSGTGNSRYSALLLGKLLGDEVFSLNELISSNNYDSLNSESPFLFVLPTYCYHIPVIVEDFIRKTRFIGNKSYFIMTCGAGVGGAGAANKELCEEKGLTYMGTLPVVMPDNYLVMYEPSDRHEAEARLAALPEKLEFAAGKILAGEAFDVKTSFLGKEISVIGSKLFNAAFVNPHRFSVTKACISCGNCVRSCPCNNIHIVNGAPEWGESCVHCLACICGCPKDAIEYGKGTKGRRRHYVYPDGTLK